MPCRRPPFISSKLLLREKGSLTIRESLMIERRKKRPNKFIWRKERTRRNKLLLDSLTRRKKFKILRLKF